MPSHMPRFVTEKNILKHNTHTMDIFIHMDILTTIFWTLPALPRQCWAALSCSENGQPLGVTVLSDEYYDIRVNFHSHAKGRRQKKWYFWVVPTTKWPKFFYLLESPDTEK